MKAEEILERAAAIAKKQVPRFNKEHFEKIYNEFTKKTKGSHTLFSKAVELLPGGSEHTLPSHFPYPLFIDKGTGSKIRDIDGNEYIDYILSGGAILLGHNNKNLNSRIVDLIQNKTNFHGFFDEYEIKAAQKIVDFFPSIDKVRFTASGGEANMAAVRIARAYTGKKKIIKFRGNYHGWLDPFMTDIEIPGSERFLSGGVPDETLDQTILVFQNDLNELETALKTHSDQGIAAVIAEPFGAESGLVPFEEDFHHQAIKLAHKYGAIYIFDEVVTGLRAGRGGAQVYFNVRPDITTLGKSLMNGYPSCGAVGGVKEIIDTASTGLPGNNPYAYVAGTTSGNVLSTAACYHTLCELEKPGVLDSSIKMAQDAVEKLNNMFSSLNTHFFAYNFGSILRIEMTAPHAVAPTSEEAIREVIFRRGILSEYSLVVHNQGVMTRMGRDMLSCSHTPQDNDKMVQAYSVLVDLLNERS